MEKPSVIFGKANHAFLISGVLVLIAGFVMMGIHSGSAAHNIYSFTKITLSPILIIAGYGLLIVSIFKT